MNRIKLLTRGLKSIEDFLAEQETFENHFRQLSSGFMLELGNVFIDRYIETLSEALGDEGGWVSWFVFECKFGKEKLQAGVKGRRKAIVDTPKKLLKLIEVK